MFHLQPPGGGGGGRGGPAAAAAAAPRPGAASTSSSTSSSSSSSTSTPQFAPPPVPSVSVSASASLSAGRPAPFKRAKSTVDVVSESPADVELSQWSQLPGTQTQPLELPDPAAADAAADAAHPAADDPAAADPADVDGNTDSDAAASAPDAARKDARNGSGSHAAHHAPPGTRPWGGDGGAAHWASRVAAAPAPGAPDAGKALRQLAQACDAASDEPARRELVVRAPGLLGLLESHALAGAGPESAPAREAALKCLLRLARSPANAEDFVRKRPLVVRAAVLNAQDARAPASVRRAALALVRNLAAVRENKALLFRAGALEAALCNAREDGAPSPPAPAPAHAHSHAHAHHKVQDTAMEALQNLSVARVAADALASDAGAVDVLVRYAELRPPRCRGAVAVLLNLASWPSSKDRVDTPRVVDALTKRLSPDTDDETKKRAAMALASLVGTDASRAHMLTSNQDVLRGVVDVLRSAVDTRGESWPLHAPVLALRSLALVPENRRVLRSEGLLRALSAAVRVTAELVPETHDARPCELAAATAQQMCFDEDSLAELKRDADMAAGLTLLLALDEDAGVHGLPEAQRAGKLLLSTLQGRLDPEGGAASAPSRAHVLADVSNAGDASAPLIMLSYAWKLKDVAVAVDDFFTRRGLRVWRDERNMSGDVVEAMMQAVKACDVFVCVISHAYHCSSFCRAEFEFARRLEKRIVPILAEPSFDFASSWVGFHLGTALYYSVAPRERFDASMQALVDKEILGKGRVLHQRQSSRGGSAPGGAESGGGRAAPALPTPESLPLDWTSPARIAALDQVAHRLQALVDDLRELVRGAAGAGAGSSALDAAEEILRALHSAPS